MARVIKLQSENQFAPNPDDITQWFKDMTEWPQKFCEYRSNQFFNHYESIGWMKGVQPIINWRGIAMAWLTLKYENDLQELLKWQRKEPREKKEEIHEDKTKAFLNDILSQYAKHPTWIDNSTLLPIYDHLKAEKGFKLNPDEVNICRGMGPEKGKAQAVKFLMDRMIKNNEKFH